MSKTLRRHQSFEASLDVTDDSFLRPPRESQRRWLLHRVMNELVMELENLDRVAADYVAGSEQVRFDDRTQGALEDQEIMEDWQIPVMRAMAGIAATAGGDVLEVGFGRGISAQMLQEEGVRSHTIVECNDSVVERYAEWREGHPSADVRLIHGTWQESTDQFESYDAILFHTYPLNEDEYLEYVASSVTFAGHFFETAARHLKPGGVFTYLTNESDSLSRAHQRLIFSHFSNMTLELVGPLAPPDDTRDGLWGTSMVVIGAVK